MKDRQEFGSAKMNGDSHSGQTVVARLLEGFTGSAAENLSGENDVEMATLSQSEPGIQGLLEMSCVFFSF